MSEYKNNNQFVMSIYEMIELMYVFVAKSNENSLSAIDYGTGEKYTSMEAHSVSLVHLNPGITAKEIAERTSRSQSSLSWMTSKLVEKGLIKTEKDSVDSRKIRMYVTDKGKELSTKHMEYDFQLLKPHMDSLVDEFGIDAVNNFLQVMERFTELYKI